MRLSVISTLAASAALIAVPLAAHAANGGTTGKQNTQGSFTYAVYGDAPYGTSPTDTSETAATPAFIAAVNADPDVSAVVHVGDIHSGSQYCTEAYDRQVAGLWSSFADPMVYTPGDNEWADCHKAKEGGGLGVDYADGNPVANLGLIRSIFFQTPGATLGSGSLQTVSQATAFDPAHPEDAAYVENVMWQRKGFVFVTLNIPGGSNNDADPWYGAPVTSAQTDEAAKRTAADVRWLDQAFDVAKASDAHGVVVVEQADMWDLDGKTAAHLVNYEPIIKSLADNTAAFGKPVLDLMGDSHVYRSDNPLQQGSTCAGDANCGLDAWTAHPYYNVPNFHRVVVHGSTFPLEYLKLVMTPGGNQPTTGTSFGPFSWTRHME